MTLSDRNLTLAEIKIYAAHQKNVNEDRSILLAAKCTPMILVARNVKYTDIHGVLLGRGRQVQ